MRKYFPFFEWLGSYDSQTFSSDLIAAIIVTIMLIPQSLAYALLAGLPPETGLYASILPLAGYAIFGTSRTLAVGPVAVVSLMTAAAVSRQDLLPPVEAAALLACLSGLFLMLLGIFRFGFLASFLSHPVVSGFITASGIIIALSQVRHLLGIRASGDTVTELLTSIAENIGDTNLVTLVLGSITLAFLFWCRRQLSLLLQRFGMGKFLANTVGRVAPVVAVIVTTVLAWQLHLDEQGVSVMGQIPGGLPSLSLPRFNMELAGSLVVPAMLISIIGYVESVSVGRTLATKRKQKINTDQELIGLGAANLASAISGGFPVTGGFSRSVVNFDAGAQTPAASLMTAVGIALATLLLADYLAWLPNATLAATIIVAVLSLVDFSILKTTWQYSMSDFAAVALTMSVTLLFGVETGVSCGVGTSLLLHLFKTSRPHVAEVGQVPGTEHFRNVLRHKVQIHPSILSLRVDESLYFANASYIEDYVYNTLQNRRHLRHVILMCTAVNKIDISALEILEQINERLTSMGISFHLSEVKGPVMDALDKTRFLQHLNGKVYLTQHQAVADLLHMELERARNISEFSDYQI
jgi:SulP family sulfate permease